jgi:hypothetical protein
MRKFFRIVGFAVLCVAGSVALLVAAAYSMGTVTVSVENKKPDGPHVYVPVPAVAIPLGMRFAPAEDLAGAATQVRPWLPAIKAASEELARCPNTTLAEVTSAEEKVRIIKDGDSIVIDVDSPEENVHVSVPLETAYTVACQFETMNERVSRSAKQKSGPTQAEELEYTN